MATLSKILGNGSYYQKTVGQQGSWTNPQTGLGYSGLKRQETDIPYTAAKMGQTSNNNPIKNVPIFPSQTPQVSQNQGYNNQQPQQQSAPQDQPQAQQSPITIFNMAILDMLKQAQSGGTAGNENLFAQQTALQRAQLGRTSQITPEEMRALSPGQQSSIRGDSAGALSPEIDAISSKIKANDMRLQNFERIVGVMREMGQEVASLNPSKEVIDGYKKMIEAGGSVSAVPEEIRDKVLSGIDWNKVEQTRLKAMRDEEAIKHAYDSSDNMTAKQLAVFNAIVNMQNRSPLMMAADRTAVLKDSIAKVRQNPKNGALQLNLTYSYIQALDTYQSSVREGELTNVNSIDSKIGSVQNSIQQIQNGQIVRPEVIIQIADAADNLVNTINSAARSKAQSFRAQAEINGISSVWEQYTSLSNPSYNQGSSVDWEYVPDTPAQNTPAPNMSTPAGPLYDQQSKSLK